MVASLISVFCVVFRWGCLATLRGVHNYAPQDLARAVAFLNDHHERYPFADLVGPWYPLARVAEAFEAGYDPRHIRVGVGGDGGIEHA